MGQGRVTFVPWWSRILRLFDYNFARNKNHETFLRHERISWRPGVIHRCWDHRSMVAATCSSRSVGAGTPVASCTISQQKSWKSSSWRSYLLRPDSDHWASQCTRCLCSKIGHCEAATTVDASQSRGSKCTRIHRIRHSLWLIAVTYQTGKAILNYVKHQPWISRRVCNKDCSQMRCRLGRFVRFYFPLRHSKMFGKTV